MCVSKRRGGDENVKLNLLYRPPRARTSLTLFRNNVFLGVRSHTTRSFLIAQHTLPLAGATTYFADPIGTTALVRAGHPPN